MSGSTIARSTTARWLARIALALCALSTLALAAGYLGLRLSLPRLDGELRLAGLAAPVTVERDALGVPTIRGTSRLDVASATGFIHAQDRLFQMDLLRRDAAGELSALVGSAALEHDQSRRFHRLRATAHAVVAALSPQERGLLRAYADGVNAGYRALTARPFEYVLLGAAPAPWHPVDTVLVVYAMYFELNDELALRARDLAHLRRALPAPVLEFIAPRGTEWDAPLEGAAVGLGPTPPPAVCDLRARALLPGNVASIGPEPAVSVGSNAWAVAGRAGAAALLANDMHLPLRVPNVWYRARLQVGDADTPALDLVGLTLPGTPALVTGSNRYIAWGFTNTYGAFSERVPLAPDPDRPGHYRVAQGSEAFREHAEVIEIKGEAPRTISVRTSRHGPVLAEPGLGLQAVRWIAHRPEFTNLRLVRLEQATTVEEALELAPTVGIPPQNLHVADRAGNIGWTVIGRLPDRTGGQWRGPLAAVDYPRIVNPPGGLLWSANARTGEGPAYERIGDGGYPLGARARQIRDRLRALASPSIGDMLAIQLDDEARFLERWRALLLRTLAAEADDGGLTPYLAELATAVRTWNGRAQPEAAGYRLVREFRHAVTSTVMHALLGCATEPAPLRVDRLHQREAAVWRLVESEPAHLLSPRFESWRALLLDAAATAVASCAPDHPSRCTWGKLNRVHITHPFERLLPRWLGHYLNVHHGPLPGGTHVPRVQAGNHGASQRLAVSPGDEANGYLHMPAGQSGHPLSRHYRAGHQQWVDGTPSPLLPGPPVHRLVLRPAEGSRDRDDDYPLTSRSSQAR